MSHGYSSLGQDVLRERERRRAPSANTPIVWVTVTVAPEHDGVARRAARADEVGGDHRLAVAGRQRVQRAPAERGQQQEQQNAPRPAAASANTPREAGRRSGRASSSPAPRARGAITRPGPRAAREGAGRACRRRAREQRRGVGAQPVRSGRRVRDARAHRGARVPERRRSAFQPTRPGNVSSRSATARGSRTAARSRQLDAGRRQAALSLRERDPSRPRRGASGDRPPVDAPVPGRAHLGALAARAPAAGASPRSLEGRDLGLVEHVAHVDAVATRRARASRWLTGRSCPAGGAAAAPAASTASAPAGTRAGDQDAPPHVSALQRARGRAAP